ncbi:MAG: peptide chain release factor N(5)-glutamine methyltransferase [Lachnospiraceae bacterium]|nr:peptide chain release factor N(5)-glutamine methyltransferase [Lachnospiraceae bacterium]
MKYHKLYEIGKNKLIAAGILEAELDSRLLLEAVCGTSKHDLLVNGERELSAGQIQTYVNHINKRENRIPLQYILGEQEFMGLKFLVTPDTLIPRQDTETLVEEVKRHLHDGQTILDMCTGTGCILLSLLYYSNNCLGWGVDISAAALDVAGRNEERIASLPRPAPPIKPVKWIKSDLFSEISGQFDIIVSNPPYIPTATIGTLMPEVCEHEPHLALDGKQDGLYFYRKIIDQSSQYLKRGGMLFLEIGCGQATDVTALMVERGFYDTVVIKDLAGHDRVVYCNII